ncbi:hypothetical protein KIH74_23635 [Kineosporia sp. J2-2]|uniref:Small secreted protein n=1 Tax=Kineosporia corallincola TaxID=2835133 RepID=A0ABS5TQK1_9ACTN|nr:hypothetical protein [Kineosporia corallincola]MBT0771954.1 hypothetical protein [Kineosporia corallincola]
MSEEDDVMFRVRSKRSALRAAVAVPAAVLLLAGCGGDDEEPVDRADAVPQTSASSPAAVDTQETLDQLNGQLEKAAEQAGAEGFGALACESVQGALLGGQAGDEEATREGLSQVLDSILTGARRGSDSLDDADLDATMKQQCPDVRQDALRKTGANSMKDLLPA